VDRSIYRLTVTLPIGDQIARLPALVARALANGEYEPGMEIFVDCRGCGAPNPQTIRALAGALEESRDVMGPIAILTDSDASFSMGRMLEILTGMAGSRSVRVFKQAPHLESWLRQAVLNG
jgi:hypothetical protein